MKAGWGAPSVPFYKQSQREESALSLTNLNPVRGKKGLQAPGSASLFFSPTSVSGGAANHQSQGQGSGAGARASSYLPAGYYAAGAAQAGNGSGMTHVGGGGNSGRGFSLGNIVPHAQGYSRTPGSPNLRPDDEERGSRPPSAFLDDMFADGTRGFEGGRI